MKQSLKSIFLFCYISLIPLAYAQSGEDRETRLAQAAQNPLGITREERYSTLPFENETNFGYGINNKTQNTLNLKPVEAFNWTPSTDLVFRTILPIALQPNPNSNSYITGIGDLNPTVFFSPRTTDKQWLFWGLGPTVVFPTASNGLLGSGKWSLGPELVFIAIPKQWTLAFLTSNIWSVGGEKNKATVSQLSFQYFITYNFSHGWYLTSQPTLIANWKERPSQVWTVPFGGGGGRAFYIGKQGLDLSLQGYVNPIRAEDSEQWFIKATLTFLFIDKTYKRA